MKKRIIALILCLAAAVSVLAGCAGSIAADSEYKGQQITMYLTENVYNLDPAYAYSNDNARSIVSLLFDTLFVLDENGKVKPSLAKSYKTEKNENGEYFMYIEIKEDARWSDNQPVTADDVVYAWKRVLNPNNSFDCAYLLFDIKNARAYSEAEVSKDDIGLTADGTLVTIQFEAETNYDQFLLNLTSLALAPLREDIASKSDDWAKKPGIMTASGPFKLSKLGFYVNDEIVYKDINYSVKEIDENNMIVVDKNNNPIYNPATEPDHFDEQKLNSYILERNIYYYRDAEDEEKLDVSVTPYRIIVDCSLTDEEIIEGYEKGVIAYIGNIPVSIRGNDTIKNNVTLGESFSTNVLYLNQNAGVTRVIPKDEFALTVTQPEETTSAEEDNVDDPDADVGADNADDAEANEDAEAETCDGKHDIVSAGYDGHREEACDICGTAAGAIAEHDINGEFTCTVCGFVLPTEEINIFANTTLRQALSLAIDRQTIADSIVYADAATGLVPNGIFDTNSHKSLFRDNAGSAFEFLSFDQTKAKSVLQNVKINGKQIVPSEYYFEITVSANDDEHLIVANALAEAWGTNGLGFNVKVNPRGTVANNDFHKDVAGVPTDFCDDLWAEDLRYANYEVAVLDLVALSADSLSVLAPFAKSFSGQAMDMSDSDNYQQSPHKTGYDSDEYNALIDKIYENKDIASRSRDLHNAESILMNDLPVIPIVFNKTAYILNEDILDINNKILFWDKTNEYYNPIIFDKISVKNYEDYELTCAKYVFEKFDTWKAREDSYFYANFADMDTASFVHTNSNYYYLFKEKYGVENYEWIPAKPEKK